MQIKSSIRIVSGKLTWSSACQIASKDDITAAFRDFISRCGHAIYTNRDSGRVWVRREDLAVMREISERFFLATLPPASPELIAEARRQGKLPPAVETADPELQNLVETLLHVNHSRKRCVICDAERYATQPGHAHKFGCSVGALNALLNGRVPRIPTSVKTEDDRGA
jgi:hypothetical protein